MLRRQLAGLKAEAAREAAAACSEATQLAAPVRALAAAGDDPAKAHRLRELARGLQGFGGHQQPPGSKMIEDHFAAECGGPAAVDAPATDYDAAKAHCRRELARSLRDLAAADGRLVQK